MKKIWILTIAIALATVACGKKKSAGPDTGTVSGGARYSTTWMKLLEKAEPASKSIGTIDDGEEVTFIQEVTYTDAKSKKETIYSKVTSADGKTGFVPKDKLAETIIVVSSGSVQAYNKPTLSSKVAGTLNAGAVCYIIEQKADWGKGSCYSATLEIGKKPVDVYGSWVRTTDSGFTKDGALAQSALSLRKAVKNSVEIDKPEMEAGKMEKMKDEIEKKLNEVISKEDSLKDKAVALMAAYKGEPVPEKKSEESTDDSSHSHGHD